MLEKKELKDSKIEIRIAKSKKDLINRLCEKRKINKSQLINSLLDDYINRNI